MTWTYKQSTGELLHNGVRVAFGYSGHGEGINDPGMEHVRSVGPCPRGIWRITKPYNSDTTGPYTMKLLAKDAASGDDTHQPTGRGAFRIHGDNSKGDRSASHGCLIFNRTIREKIWNSGDHEIEVVK